MFEKFLKISKIQTIIFENTPEIYINYVEKMDEMIDEVVLNENTNYVDGAMDKEVRIEGHILKCITLRELYRFPSYVNPENPHHRKIPYEISSVSFSL